MTQTDYIDCKKTLRLARDNTITLELNYTSEDGDVLVFHLVKFNYFLRFHCLFGHTTVRDDKM